MALDVKLVAELVSSVEHVLGLFVVVKARKDKVSFTAVGLGPQV